jgi:hypothetical protein
MRGCGSTQHQIFVAQHFNAKSLKNKHNKFNNFITTVAAQIRKSTSASPASGSSIKIPASLKTIKLNKNLLAQKALGKDPEEG